MQWCHGCRGLLFSAKAVVALTTIHWTRPASSVEPSDQDNLHLVQPIARHYAQQTGLENDDLLQVGRLGLIKACNRYDALRWANFPSFAKPHIRGAIFHFLRDSVGLIRLPRALEERAMRMMRSPGGSVVLSTSDSLVVYHPQ